ncbi:MAG TPA: M1 family metallopeptidase, partial [Acidimicrobiales bacterium]|nr:M1 family metallopeptidase [Acidimicrobiales bacterium]
LCEDDYRPEWEVFTSFGQSKGAALGVDGLHATRPVEFAVRWPDDAAAMFDVLTYEKGASVLWMIEQYLGPGRFRAGVRRYLASHAYANTETHDLWDAIETEAEGVPVRAIMDTWIFQGGYPLVSAGSRIGEDGADRLELSQAPFAYLPAPPRGDGGGESAIGSDWIVPVIVRFAGGEIERVLLTSSGAELRSGPAPVVVNAGGAGFYRVSYDAPARSELLARYESLSPAERYGVVADAWATCLAGRSSLREVSEVLDRVASETDPHVWSVAIGALGLLDVLAPDELRPRVASYAHALLAPQLARVGWERAAGEDELTPMLRATVISALGTFARDGAVALHCAELFAADSSGGAQVAPDIASAVLGVVAHHARRAELDAMLARYHRPRDPLDEDRHVRALGRVSDPALAREVHELCLREVRSQSAPFVLSSMLASRSVGPMTWEFVTEHFDELANRFPEGMMPRMLGGVASLAWVDADGVPVLAGAVRAFLEQRVVGGFRRLVDQSLERLEVNVRLGRRLPAELDSLVSPG